MGEIVAFTVTWLILAVIFVLVTGIRQIIRLSLLQIQVSFLHQLLVQKSSITILLKGCTIAGDGFCDDSTNDGRCDFDGGDCCLPNINDQYCTFCICYADNPEGEPTFCFYLF